MKGERKMDDSKKAKKEIIKRVLALFLVGSLAYEMSACGSGGQKKGSTQIGEITESGDVAEEGLEDRFL